MARLTYSDEVVELEATPPKPNSVLKPSGSRIKRQGAT